MSFHKDRDTACSQYGFWRGVSGRDLEQSISCSGHTEIDGHQDGLDVGFDVLFPAELLVTALELANPLVVDWIWAFD